MKHYSTHSLSVLTATCALLLTFPAGLSAVTKTWDGGGANNNISTGANWADNTAPTLSSTDAVFAGSTRLAPAADTDVAYRSITFAPSAGSFHITHPGSSQLVPGTGGITNQTALHQTLDVMHSGDQPGDPRQRRRPARAPRRVPKMARCE